MPDGDSFHVDENFLDQQPQDSLTLRHLHRLGLDAQTVAKLCQRVGELQVARLISSGEFHRSQFRLYRLLLLAQLGHASAQLLQG